MFHMSVSICLKKKQHHHKWCIQASYDVDTCDSVSEVLAVGFSQ